MTRAIETRDKLETMLSGMEKEFAKVLQNEITPEAFCRVALSCVGKNPKLLKCTPASFFGALMDCAELSLHPGSVLGHAYLVPYKDQCTLVIGYKGLVDLARRSGLIDSIGVDVVYPEDHFRVQRGTEPRIEHHPEFPDNDDDNRITHVYATADLVGSTKTEFEVMTRAQVERIRNGAVSRDSIPWKEHWAEMAKKTVLRRLCKRLPLSGKRWVQALERDDADYGSAPRVRTISLEGSIPDELLPAISGGSDDDDHSEAGE